MVPPDAASLESQGFPGYYATRSGDLWSTLVSPPRKIKVVILPTITGVRIRHCSGKFKTVSVPPLILRAFGVTPSDPKDVVYPKDGDLHNLQLCNLEWGRRGRRKTSKAQSLFGDHLSRWRFGNGISQDDFCAMTGLNRTQISGYETRGILPGKYSRIALAAVIGIEWLQMRKHLPEVKKRYAVREFIATQKGCSPEEISVAIQKAIGKGITAKLVKYHQQKTAEMMQQTPKGE